MHNLAIEAYKALLRRILKDLKNGRIYYFNEAILSKLVCRFNEIPIKIPAGFCLEVDKLILKFA